MSDPEQMVRYGQMVRRARTVIPQNLGGEDPWTQEVLADLLGVTTNYVAMVERGEREPSEMFRRALDWAVQLSKATRDPRSRSVW